jgi:uncharacterized membrane protein (UPF0127 family)
MRIVSITNTTRNTVIGNNIHVADTSFTRLFGLLGKPQLDAGSGLWIKPSSGVHTFGMTIPIDVIGLDKQLRVVKLWPNLVPFRVTSVSFKMLSVIELRAGQIAATGTQLGDLLSAE